MKLKHIGDYALNLDFVVMVRPMIGENDTWAIEMSNGAVFVIRGTPNQLKIFLNPLLDDHMMQFGGVRGI